MLVKGASAISCGVGVSKTISLWPYFRSCLFIKTLVTSWKPLSYLEEVATIELRRHLSNMNAVKKNLTNAFVRSKISLSEKLTLPVTGEFPSQRPVTRSFDVFLDLRPNIRLSKQSQDWWFETLSRPLWRHCNVKISCTAVLYSSQSATC